MQETSRGYAVPTPRTMWHKPDEAYTFVAKPATPIKSKGVTKHDDKFDRMLADDVALVVPQDDLAGVLKAWARYERNKEIQKMYSVRRKIDTKRRTYAVWLEKRTK